MGNLIERLFCCECGKEVILDGAGMVAPSLKTGRGEARPHVWCKSCARDIRDEGDALKRKHEANPGAERTDEYQLHHYIWTGCDEGREEDDLLHFHGFGSARVAAAMTKLTRAGKVHFRLDDGRWVALCAPWQTPSPRADEATADGAPPWVARSIARAERRKCESVEGLAHDVPIHEQYGNKRPWGGTRDIPADYASVPPGAMPHPDEQDEVFHRASEELPKPEELHADRYPGDVERNLSAVHERLNRIEGLMKKVLERVDHLVCMDNDEGELNR